MLCHVPFSLTSHVSWAWLPPSHRPVRPSAQWRAVPSLWAHKEGQTQCWEEVAGVRECTWEGPSPPRESHCLHRLTSEHHSSHPLSPLAPHATSFPSPFSQLSVCRQLYLPWVSPTSLTFQTLLPQLSDLPLRTVSLSNFPKLPWLWCSSMPRTTSHVCVLLLPDSAKLLFSFLDTNF